MDFFFSTEVLVVTTILLELTLLSFANRNFGLKGLQIMTIVNLILISFFASKLLTVFGLTSNIGNIFYSMVVVSQGLIFFLYGEEQAKQSIWVAYMGIIATVLLAFFLRLFPTIDGNETYSTLVNSITATQIPIVAASFGSFWVTQRLFIYLAQKWRKKSLWVSYGVSSIIAQVFNSLLFFPFAFYHILTIPQIIEVTIVGIIIKSTIDFLCTPFIYAMKKVQH